MHAGTRQFTRRVGLRLKKGDDERGPCRVGTAQPGRPTGTRSLTACPVWGASAAGKVLGEQGTGVAPRGSHPTPLEA
jgi:hypothetical protein